ncbi:MAG: CdaR family protein [Oscillospiraceae bacterium]|nr:CdaR family protein [Oscillospiraceae bacterium]
MKKKISIHGLFMNNKFVLVFSILLAIVIWGAASMTVAPEDTRVIENVKVTIEENEDSGYQIFGYQDTYIDVTVKGRRYLISPGALSADDISVVAKSKYVDYSGKQKLNLTATVKGNNDVKITDMSENSITVYYDTPKTSVFPVEVKLNSNLETVPEGYISLDPIASISNVTVTGPATEINKIEKVVAQVNLDYSLTETTALEAELQAVTANGSEAKYVSFVDDVENFTVTIPVSKVVEKPVSVRYLNMPEFYNDNMLEVNIYPKTVKVAAAQSVLDEMESLIIGTIDFSSLTNKNNKFTFSLNNIEEVKIMDGTTEVKVTVNCYPMSKKKFNVQSANVTFLNLGADQKASLVDKNIPGVQIIGPSASLSSLDGDTQLYAKIDLSGATEGVRDYKAVIYIKDNTRCWVYGEYTAKVRISKK